jgi:hypothetical protein
MSIDGTTLPDGVTIVTHGCGEDFPAEDVGDSESNEKNRRVEIFTFPNGIAPPPDKDTSRAGDTFYPSWLAQVDETIDFTDKQPDLVRVQLFDHTGSIMPETPFAAFFGKGPLETGTSDGDGFAHLKPPAVCPEMLHIAWGNGQADGSHLYFREVFVDCTNGESDSRASARLYNLGYPARYDLDLAVRLFQTDRKIDHEPEPVGLIDGRIPETTRREIDKVFDH